MSLLYGELVTKVMERINFNLRNDYFKDVTKIGEEVVEKMRCEIVNGKVIENPIN